MTHAPLEHGGHAEAPAGILGVLTGAPEREGGRGGRDLEPGHTTESGGHLLGHPIAEELVGAVGAGVHEREDRDRAGPRLRRRGGRRRCRGRVPEPEREGEEAEDGEGEEGPMGRQAAHGGDALPVDGAARRGKRLLRWWIGYVGHG